MACNVWLSFFRSYDVSALRPLEMKYIIVCYGIPFVPTVIYLFIKAGGRGKVYATALLRCWVSVEWDFLRVVTFYGPVWVVILLTIAMYVQVGSLIFKWRQRLLFMDRNTTGEAHEYPAMGIMKTSEVTITGIEEQDDGIQTHSAHFSRHDSFSEQEDTPTDVEALPSRPVHTDDGRYDKTL